MSVACLPSPCLVATPKQRWPSHSRPASDPLQALHPEAPELQPSICARHGRPGRPTQGIWYSTTRYGLVPTPKRQCGVSRACVRSRGGRLVTGPEARRACCGRWDGEDVADSWTRRSVATPGRSWPASWYARGWRLGRTVPTAPYAGSLITVANRAERPLEKVRSAPRVARRARLTSRRMESSSRPGRLDAHVRRVRRFRLAERSPSSGVCSTS